MKSSRQVCGVLALSTALSLAIVPISVSAQGQPRGEGKSEISKAPAEAREARNPYAANPAAHRAGGKLYKRHCSSCHGPEARGQDRYQGLAKAHVRDAAPGALFWYLRNGDIRRGMPSWSNLPAPQLWQLVTYLQGLNVTEERPHTTETARGEAARAN